MKNKKNYIIITVILLVCLGAFLVYDVPSANTTNIEAPDTVETNYEVLHQQMGAESPVSKINEGMAKDEVDTILGEATKVGLSSQGYDTYSYVVDNYLVYVFYDSNKVTGVSVTE